MNSEIWKLVLKSDDDGSKDLKVGKNILFRRVAGWKSFPQPPDLQTSNATTKKRISSVEDPNLRGLNVSGRNEHLPPILKRIPPK